MYLNTTATYLKEFHNSPKVLFFEVDIQMFDIYFV